MANHKQLKLIANARLRSANFLIKAGDWDGAVYMMGYVLECALKAAACKALRLGEYPENKKTHSHFMTHSLDQLLVLSGMSDLFNILASNEVFKNWSEFTQEFQGEWPRMRYDLNRQQSFDEIKTKKLYNNLVSTNEGILSVITKKKRW